MAPIAQPGPLTERERFMFEATGYLVIPNALSQEEAAACLDASQIRSSSSRRRTVRPSMLLLSGAARPSVPDLDLSGG